MQMDSEQRLQKLQQDGSFENFHCFICMYAMALRTHLVHDHGHVTYSLAGDIDITFTFSIALLGVQLVDKCNSGTS